ncbi:hypothetical protein FHP29_20035 [Nocardioides albidus]|uniref:WD40 repeat domain-containing protein n=1 Tax=Nocardioides albidus TaxID=1517589 RepID=A0A5C4VKV9_9ACTN|nr:hypothetical protein [Nocardioides albidus]TNM36432.1 hypothetical protein FHP29_20035 [Nocardioides albidus]
MTRVVVLLLCAALLSGCDNPVDGVLGGSDDVLGPQLPAADVLPVPGPTYVEEVQMGKPRLIIHAPGHTTAVRRGWEAAWRPDGTVLVLGSSWARVLDPATGAWLSGRARIGEYGVTPEALTTLGGPAGRVLVYDAALAGVRKLTVPSAAAETDQIDGLDAEFQLHGRPYTLGGVTFVEWGINSEDDTRTDHGLFRIEGEEITQALRNEPLVRLWPSFDGAALLAIMQDNGEDEDCGGCKVEQKIVELDPDTGEIAADYGMPPGYARAWRISSLDKVDRTVVVQFVVRPGESGGSYQTWTYDGSWHRLAEAGDTRSRFQAGGVMAWSGDTGEPNQPFTLTWTPASGESVVLRDPSSPCPEDETFGPVCPTISLPGSLLPLD